jgi:hypothetical protein
MDAMPAARLPPMLAEQGPGGGIKQPDVPLVPLHGDLTPKPPRGRRVVRAGDLDAAVEMHGARAVLVVAEGLKGQRPQLQLRLGEHGGDLALDGPRGRRRAIEVSTDLVPWVRVSVQRVSQ